MRISLGRLRRGFVMDTQLEAFGEDRLQQYALKMFCDASTWKTLSSCIRNEVVSAEGNFNGSCRWSVDSWKLTADHRYLSLRH